MSVQLTPRDETVIWTLTRKVRVLTLEQAARTWWPASPHPPEAATASLMRLEREGLVRLVSIMAHPEIELNAPAFRWEPGGSEPHFGSIAYQLRARWKLPPVSTKVVAATKEAVRRFGGFIGDRLPRAAESTHDIHLTQVYLQILENDPSAAKRWVCEHELYSEGRGRHERLPDAVIRPRHRGAEQTLVIEFAGRYAKRKLQEFHAEMNPYPYELW